MNELQALQCEQFEMMRQEDQLDALRTDGVYIGKLKHENGNRLLYQYRNIYVEVVYLRHRDVVKHVHCYADVAILDSYFSED